MHQIYNTFLEYCLLYKSLAQIRVILPAYWKRSWSESEQHLRGTFFFGVGGLWQSL